MLRSYRFDQCSLTCGQHKTAKVDVDLKIDVESGDRYAPPAPPGKYHNGFACEGELIIEWPTSVPLYFKRHLPAHLAIFDQGDDVRLKIVLMEQIKSIIGIPGALPGSPCRTKFYIWRFICLDKPLVDDIGLFPEHIKRPVMKVFAFSKFPGHWNDTKTFAIVTASCREHAIIQMNDQLKEKGLARLIEGDYDVVELDPTRPSTVFIADGSN